LRQRQHEGGHRRKPGANRQPLNRQHERTNVKNGCNIERDAGPQTGSGVEQSACKIKQEQARSSREQRTEKAHSEFVRSENRSACANREGNAGPFAEIGRRKALRPHPIMRLIKFEIGCCQRRQSNRREGDNEKPDRARCSHAECCCAPSVCVPTLGAAIKLG